jgi:alkanesulfonate monooxygenase SsuD/methylene tetrahydromethanopterin reductase-like flavin-dependent oxidoreductase (luciferase family)
MRYGVSVPNIGDAGTLLELGLVAEGAGWDGFFVWDHIRFSAEFPVRVFDPWVLLGALAARTTRIRLGPMVTPLARRRPWKLARESVTLDHLSGGRAVLGVGLGFPPDAEFAMLGDDPSDAVRAEKLDEGLELLSRFWSEERFDHDGRHFQIRDGEFHPGPLQRPRIPIWVAGMWPNRAPFRRAARWDGVFPIGADADGQPRLIDPAGLQEVVAFTRSLRADPEAPFEVIVQGAVDLGPADYERAGATWWLLSDDGDEGWQDRIRDQVAAGPGRYGYSSRSTNSARSCSIAR